MIILPFNVAGVSVLSPVILKKQPSFSITGVPTPAEIMYISENIKQLKHLTIIESYFKVLSLIPQPNVFDISTKCVYQSRSWGFKPVQPPGHIEIDPQHCRLWESHTYTATACD